MRLIAECSCRCRGREIHSVISLTNDLAVEVEDCWPADDCGPVQRVDSAGRAG